SAHLRRRIQVETGDVVAPADRTVVDPVVVAREVVGGSGTALGVNVARCETGSLRGDPGWAVARADQVRTLHAGCDTIPRLPIRSARRCVAQVRQRQGSQHRLAPLLGLCVERGEVLREILRAVVGAGSTPGGEILPG